MRYREHIDGLRAVAVVPVVLFHLDVAPFSGGFTGVDVFFVISGFLITSIILDELAEGRFTIGTFYKRRVARILPVLASVLIAVGLALYLTAAPREIDLHVNALRSAAAFGSNIYFWKTSSYFDPAADESPLLHTWSLSVEEQFYLIVPLAMVLAWRLMPRLVLPLIAVASLLSFGLSVYASKAQPAAAFYLLPTRSWELGLGAMAAFAPDLSRRFARPANEVLAWAGLGLIAFGIFGLSGADTFPGFNALYPAAGAALVILFGERASLGTALRVRPLVYVGLVSYALYMWHWPIIVFFVRAFGSPGAGAVVLLAFVSLAAAAMTRVLIEAPARRMLRRSPTSVVNAGAVACLALLFLGASALGPIFYATRTFPPEAVRAAEYLDYRETRDFREQFRHGTCMLAGSATSVDAFDRRCLTPDPDRPNYLVLGDSHAAHLWQALQIEIPAIHFMQATAAGCQPLRGYSGGPVCTDHLQFIFDEFIPGGDVDGLVLSARWMESDLDRLVATVQWAAARGVDVIVLGPAPEYSFPLPLLLAKKAASGGRPPAAYEISSRADVDRTLSDGLRAKGLKYFSVRDALCTPRCLEVTPAGVPLQFDYGHFTIDGARIVARKVGDACPFRAGCQTQERRRLD